MKIISLRLNEEEQSFVEEAAQVYGCSASTLIKRLAFEKLEDEFDMKAIEEYEREKKNGTLVLKDFDDLIRETEIENVDSDVQHIEQYSNR